jgi:hypothetical protein
MDEEHMIEDYDYAVKLLENVRFRLQRSTGNHTTSNIPGAGLVPDLQQQSSLFGLPYGIKAEMTTCRDHEEGGEDVTEERHASVVRAPTTTALGGNGAFTDIEFLTPFQTKYEETTKGRHVVVDLFLPPALFQLVPEFFFGAKNTFLSKQIPVVPVMFTQGVNEMQSIANKIGNTGVQELINLNGSQRLMDFFKAYVKAFQRGEKDALAASPVTSMKLDARAKTATTPPLLARAPSLHRRETSQLRGDMTYADLLMKVKKLKRAVTNQSEDTEKAKNMDILLLSTEIMRRIPCCGRIVSCKSAKDRTSMDVTWEEASLLHELAEVKDMQKVMDLFRGDGVRRSNVLDNTGKHHYAFNVLQRSVLPDVFVPPAHTCNSKVKS